MKYIVSIIFIVLIAVKKCDNYAPLTLHFVVVEKDSKKPIAEVGIGNIDYNQNPEKFVPNTTTNKEGRASLKMDYKRIAGEPLQYLYVLKKDGYTSKKIDANTHGFRSEDVYNVVIDTIYLIPTY